MYQQLPLERMYFWLRVKVKVFLLSFILYGSLANMSVSHNKGYQNCVGQSGTATSALAWHCRMFWRTFPIRLKGEKQYMSS